MNETEYIVATNLAKIRIAYFAIADCSPSCGAEDFGMSLAEREAILNPLFDVRETLTKLTEIEDEPDQPEPCAQCYEHSTACADCDVEPEQQPEPKGDIYDDFQNSKHIGHYS